MLRSRRLQCGLDGAIEICARVRSEANKTLYELALAIEDECLWNRVLIRKQKGHEIFVGPRERVLNTEFLCERRHFLFVAWSTDVESDNSNALVLILLL